MFPHPCIRSVPWEGIITFRTCLSSSCDFPSILFSLELKGYSDTIFSTKICFSLFLTFALFPLHVVFPYALKTKLVSWKQQLLKTHPLKSNIVWNLHQLKHCIEYQLLLWSHTRDDGSMFFLIKSVYIYLPYIYIYMYLAYIFMMSYQFTMISMISTLKKNHSEESGKIIQTFHKLFFSH